jgi:hypothetical protein
MCRGTQGRLSALGLPARICMKWLIVFCVLFLGIAAVLWFPGREERLCLHYLAVFDHHINCLHHLERMGATRPDENGEWPRSLILGMTPEKYLRCPVTGREYDLTFKVGEHPSCPVHGALIEKYGYLPHQPIPGLRTRYIVTAISALLGAFLGLSAAANILIRKLRQRKLRVQAAAAVAE